MTLKLDENQQKAVEHFEGPALVVAGPGSGKTTVITKRILHLIREHNVDPKQILAIKMKVIKLSKSNNNIVFSRRAWLEENRTKLLDTLEEGQYVTGVVKISRLSEHLSILTALTAYSINLKCLGNV